MPPAEEGKSLNNYMYMCTHVYSHTGTYVSWECMDTIRHSATLLEAGHLSSPQVLPKDPERQAWRLAL